MSRALLLCQLVDPPNFPLKAFSSPTLNCIVALKGDQIFGSERKSCFFSLSTMELLYAHLLSRNHSLYLNSLLAVRTCECNRIVLNGVSHVEKAPVSKELLIQSENVVLLCLCIPVLCITLIIIYAITLHLWRHTSYGHEYKVGFFPNSWTGIA